VTEAPNCSGTSLTGDGVEPVYEEIRDDVIQVNSAFHTYIDMQAVKFQDCTTRVNSIGHDTYMEMKPRTKFLEVTHVFQNDIQLYGTNLDAADDIYVEPKCPKDASVYVEHLGRGAFQEPAYEEICNNRDNYMEMKCLANTSNVLQGTRCEPEYLEMTARTNNLKMSLL
jgi:hypothetical protein